MTSKNNDQPQHSPHLPEWQDPVKALDNFDQAIFREMVRQPKVTISDLARLFQADRKTVRKRLRKPEFKYALGLAMQDANKDAVQLLKELAPEAVKTLKRNQNAQSRTVQVQAARAALDYAVGRKSILQGGNKPVEIDLSPEAKTQIAKSILEKRKELERSQRT